MAEKMKRGLNSWTVKHLRFCHTGFSLSFAGHVRHSRRWKFKHGPSVNFVSLLLILSFSSFLPHVKTQSSVTSTIRDFPSLFNAGQNRPIATEPSDSTCGVGVSGSRSAYCRSAEVATSITQCSQAFCEQTCPNRVQIPMHIDLLFPSNPYSDCVSTDTVNRRPGSFVGNVSTYFIKGGPICFITPVATPVLSTNGAFTITVWIWQEAGNRGTLVEKRSNTNSETVFELQVQQTRLIFMYRSVLGLTTIVVNDDIPPRTWTHVAVQVYGTSLSVFINGLDPGYSAAHTETLISAVQDVSDASIRVGQTLSGTNQYLGRLQDFRFYQTTLSNREVAEDYSGTLPKLRVQSECRCPLNYPRIKPRQIHYCIKNGVADNTNDDIPRLNLDAHPLEYVNDGDSNSLWISKFQNQANLIVDLGDEFQIFYVVLQFYSPLPKAVMIERQQEGSTQWEVWQMYAMDCEVYFQVGNNGPLPTPTSVNCIRFNDSTPYSKGNITFNILAPEPVARPGYNDFYNTPDLHQFVKASKVRVQMREHYYVTKTRHEYYGLYEFSVIGRCDCHGHAATCDHSSLPYQCNCSAESYTEGRMCEQCQPLYNNKAFRRGDQINPFNCQPCECYDHATSCYYNATADPFPDDHFSGGGGICKDCQDNTAGRYCDTCVTYYYRPLGKSKYDPDVCRTCDCYLPGIVNGNLDCVKEGGQCNCKQNVGGRQCSECLVGFFNLRESNPVGCELCNCLVAGTRGGDISCHPDTGVCNCKNNVRNDKCDECEFGYYNLSARNPLGCDPCNCNPAGAQNVFCDPVSGQCICKTNVIGQHCGECAEGFYDFLNGCLPCNCNPTGSEPNTFCDKGTGQCQCKKNVQGVKCNECKDESFAFGSSGLDGCSSCDCDAAGTVNGSNLCDKVLGNCVCKDNVAGPTCNLCKGNTWGLNISYPEGCLPCDCDPTGTDDASCDQNDGQCTCVTNRVGRRCDDCRLGYFVLGAPMKGCKSCNCHDFGTLPLTKCDTKTGQCQCKGGDSGVTGISCNECLLGYYAFNGALGVCNPCDCAVAGSVNDTCDTKSGQCECKEFTEGRRCDACVPGSSYLDAANPYGCSKTPTQQPPPVAIRITSTSIALRWEPPDYPNGIIKYYKLFRNDTEIYFLGPNEREVMDNGLEPYTVYSYILETANDFGKVNSTAVSFRTSPGPPTGVISLTATSIRSTSATFSWNEPAQMNGPLVNYKLLSVTPSSPEITVEWEGKSRIVSLTTLVPFTNYTFNVNACTDGGCLRSEPLTFSTQSSVPQQMSPPVITPLSATEVLIEWEPPAQPNGIIIFYELWMRGLIGPGGIRDPPEMRIFNPSGQFNPRPTVTPQENALPPPATNYTVDSLEPFTEYEFQVLAENDAGKAASPWVRGRTGETTPLTTPTPVVLTISSSQLNITWTAPTPGEALGNIIVYQVFYYEKTNLTAMPFAPPFIWKLLENATGSQFYHVLKRLSPYSEHVFKVGACNSVGCVNSTEVTGRTDQAVAEGLMKPDVNSINSTSIEIHWEPPVFPNGPDPVYTVQKTVPALSYPPRVISGTRFPGGGYYLFPPETIPANVGFTGVRFWFRTRQREGLLLFAASDGRQEEFIALQFKASRPWFLFDPQDCPDAVELNDNTTKFDDGEWHFLAVFRNATVAYISVDGNFTGCASFVTPTNDEGISFSDNKWHQLVAWRDGKVAFISIDGAWKGERINLCAEGTIIGPNTGLYVGGLPANFEIRREDDGDIRTDLVPFGFQGCIRDIQVMQQKYPVEIWKTLDWNDAITNELAFLNWEGCPTNLEAGIHFMGQGFARFPYNPDGLVLVGNSRKFEFSFRTQMHSGIFFFAYGGQGIYIYSALIDGRLHFEFANGITVGSVTMSRPTINFCDSAWYTVSLSKIGQQAAMNVTYGGKGSDVLMEVQGDPSTYLSVLTKSDFFVGGIPPGSEAHRFVLDNKLAMPTDAFGGCIRDFLIYESATAYRQLNFLQDTLEVANVNMDGCTPFVLFEETCKDDLIANVYTGSNTSAWDVGLTPYSDYLYRVTATNNAGSGTSPWGYGRTKEGAPSGIQPPYDVVALDGFTIEAHWREPQSTSGLLSMFILRAYDLDNVTAPPVEEIFNNITLRFGNMTSVVPNTNYNVKLAACTSGGCGESSSGVRVTTPEEAPQDVPAPTADPGATYISVNWAPPGKPNGVITGYFLFMDDVLIYSGGFPTFNVTNLQVYTAYRFFVRACTVVGCTDGPTVPLSTAQLPPTFMKPPKLLALGTTRVEARWEMPQQLNGVLERYLLYVSTDNTSLGELMYNNSDFFDNYIITDLIAGTTYFISVAACTGGGCRVSDPSNVTTEESAPEGVPDPTAVSPSPSVLLVSWGEPALPNGAIIRYELYHNEVPTYIGLDRNFTVTNLEPYSLHAFRVSACTSKGCGSSGLVRVRTREAAPEGFVIMELRVDNSRTISVKWNMPEQPNGNIFFDVYLDGLFYSDPENWDYSTVSQRRSLHRSHNSSVWIVISPVIPMTSYEVQVNASNTEGFILSNKLSAVMPPGTPDGVKPPDLVSQTPTTVTATWIAVGRTNSVEDPQFILQFKTQDVRAVIEDIFGPTTAFTYTKQNLLPFTVYDFRIVASNTHGSTYSEWVSQVTRQDRPTGFDPPLIAGIGPRYVDLMWVAPLTPNGILLEYKVYQNNAFRESLEANVTSLRADDLRPYTYYMFVLDVCTIGGCTRSGQSSTVRTMEDIPEGIASPTGTSLTPTSIELRWREPTFPNGVISLYKLDRRVSGSSISTTIVTVAHDDDKVYVDEDSSLSPFVEYEYRLIVRNGAGEGLSDWRKITTKPSRPSGVNPPTIKIIGPTIMNVTWQTPIEPNGVIEFYTIRLRLVPPVEIRNTSITYLVFDDLIPYMEYTVTVTACTAGGCTESPAVVVRTHATVPEGQRPPTPTPVSQSLITLVWQQPRRPNGPNIRFELSRRKVRQPLDPFATGFDIWVSLYAGTANYFEDRGLPLYTTFQYRITVYNDIGQMTSDPSADVMTFGGFPRMAPEVWGQAVSHVAIRVNWTTPSEVELQGRVIEYKVKALSKLRNYTRSMDPGSSETMFQQLTPNTDYAITVTVIINGGNGITNEPIIVTTLDGAPEGLETPTLTIVSETALRVAWSAPETPNGDVTGYNIYINDEKIETGLNLPGSYVVRDLLPYTVYTILVEVCTVFDCVKSPSIQGTTAEALSQGVQSPEVIPLSSAEIHVIWTKPTQPNGIILRYDLWRKTIKLCSEIPTTTVSPELTKCTYIECNVLQNLCGSTCYSGPKVCCDSILYDSASGHECCGTSYVPRSSTDDVCCGGVFHTKKNNYECCRDRYEKVLPGQICCPDPDQDRVAIGYGESCCGPIPYSSDGAQVCCSGSLQDRYGQQCCGGDMVSDDLVCCGGEVSGHAYTYRSNQTCCGKQFVHTDSTLCCTSDTSDTKVHHYASSTVKQNANEKCCGLEKISNTLSCCNFIGYNPLTQTCADLSHQQGGCGTGTVCAGQQSDTAFCNRCDFNKAARMCGAIEGQYSPNTTPAPQNPSDKCVIAEDRLYSGMEMDYVDGNLSPYSLYEYAVSVVNSAGASFGDFALTRTLQAAPVGLDPPTAKVDPLQLYVIHLSWTMPQEPNGELIRFILTRDGIELYRGLDFSYTDETTITPYQSYTYLLTACTIAGCVTSPKLVIATAQAAPEHVLPPVLTFISDIAVLVSWSPPAKPNGIIVKYTVYLYGGDRRSVHTTTPDKRSLTIGNLKSYSDYNVSLEVCTEAGCTGSENTTIKTPEAQPEEMAAPKVIIRSATSADVYWKAPRKPNGQIQFYAVIRTQGFMGMRIFFGDDFHTVDTRLSPGLAYSYYVITGTSAGNTSSPPTNIKMPTATPTNIPSPDNVTVLSSTQMFVSWEAMVLTDGAIDQYRVLLNAGRSNQVSQGVGLDVSATIGQLKPFTDYEVRIQACLQGVADGCGTGPGVVVTTFEDLPTDMKSPTVVARAPNLVDISWKPPTEPNGIILQYLVYYREFGKTVELLINQVSGDTLFTRHTGPELNPYEEYEYKVVAGNSAGDASSPWSYIRTLEAAPQDLGQPFVNVTGAFSVDLKWIPPIHPNGVITMYRILYTLIVDITDPTTKAETFLLSINSSLTETTVGGLIPYSDYQLQLQAFNSKGNVSSPFVTFKTGESSPSGLGLFDIEKIDTGEAVILRWGEPVDPYGVITTYRIFEDGSSVAVFQGLNQEFELRRLQPYTEYSIQLEACTSAGCTKSAKQQFRTAEIPPTAQPSATMANVTATSVVIVWTKPVNSNGKITLMELFRRANSRLRKRAVSDPIVIYRTTDTDADTFQFTDFGLEPFTEYQYMVKSSNSKGSTESPWQSIFTLQAPPEGVLPPVVSHVENKLDTLNVKWSEPQKANGVLQSYHIQRNDSVPLSFGVGDPKEFNDTGLTAYTWYKYTLRVCSGGGCTTSEPAIALTMETAPLFVSPPTLIAINSTALKATWQKPQITTGVISSYQLKMDGIPVYEGTELSHTVGGLTPYKEYSFILQACTSGGCMESGDIVGRPDDAPPQGMLPPILRVMSSNSIEITWQPPEFPNGIITSYDVRRDGRLIYTESVSVTGSLRTMYTDYNLNAGTEYSYIVLARNRKGSVESPPSLAMTYSSSPAGLDPPVLQPLSATTIQATWEVPAKPNGDIKNYTLFRDGSLAYSGGPEKLSYIVPGLRFWTEYSFRVQACTDRGCVLSASAAARTLESRPEEQGRPTLRALGNTQGAHAGVQITWEPPLKPNGVILGYEVYRRQVFREVTGISYGPTKAIYNGTQFQYTDKDAELLPFTDYQYSVSAVNKVGKIGSLWEEVLTKQAPPEAVPAPIINGTTATTITVTLTPPSVPNGIVQLYNVFANGTLGSGGTDLYQTIGSVEPLKPFTAYALTAEACTAGGCTRSLPVIATTGTSKPTGQDPLEVLDFNSTSARLRWSHPSRPNGEIIHFLLYQRSACPPSSQPYQQDCVVGVPVKVYQGLNIEHTVTGLIPYTAYEFQVQSVNEAGAIDFPVWVPVQTEPSVPSFIQTPRLYKNDSLAIIDWSNSFSLNGELQEYKLEADGKLVLSGVTTSGGVDRETKDQKIEFIVTCVTKTGTVSSGKIIFDPNAVGNIGVTTTTAAPPLPPQEREFYQEVWFIVVLVLVGVLIIFIIVACCLRRSGTNKPYIRERLPLQSRQMKNQEQPFTFCVDANDGSIFAKDLEQKKGTYNRDTWRSAGVVNPAFANGTPYKKKVKGSIDKDSFLDELMDEDMDDDDFLWEKTHDSGLYDDDSLTAPSYSITKEQTVFTDTHL